MALPTSAELDRLGLPDAVLVLDPGGRIVAASEPTQALLGHSPEKLCGREFAEVFAPRDADGAPVGHWPVAVLLPTVRRSREVALDLSHAGGRTVKCAATLRYHRDGGRFAGAVLSLRDVGDRRLDSAAAQAIAICAHEIRAPLTGVRGFASLLLHKGGSLGEAQRDELLGHIVHDAERLTRLVGELLDVSRLEAGRLSLGIEDLDVGDVVTNAVALANSAVAVIAADGHAMLPVVELDIAPGTIVSADRDKLTQIFVNLIENAMKYGEEPVTITCSIDTDEETAAVCVHDGGFIDPDVLDRLFSKFVRRERPGRPSGTGLGLFIARGLAEAQGGSLEATSSEDDGTRFVVTLPLA